MLYWVCVFLLCAVVSAVLGFGGVATGAAMIAKYLTLAFVIAAAAVFIAYLADRHQDF